MHADLHGVFCSATLELAVRFYGMCTNVCSVPNPPSSVLSVTCLSALDCQVVCPSVISC